MKRLLECVRSSMCIAIAIHPCKFCEVPPISFVTLFYLLEKNWKCTALNNNVTSGERL